MVRTTAHIANIIGKLRLFCFCSLLTNHSVDGEADAEQRPEERSECDGGVVGDASYQVTQHTNQNSEAKPVPLCGKRTAPVNTAALYEIPYTDHKETNQGSNTVLNTNLQI